MSSWTPLLPTLMVGTERQGGPLPEWPGEVGELIAQVGAHANGPAEAVLRVAAVLAPCLLAGVQPGAAPNAPPAPADADQRPAPPAALLPLLQWALQDGPARLHLLVMETLAAAGYRLPPVLLPLALDLGRRSTALRAALLRALGERGLWLAAQREEWRYAAGAAGDEPQDTHWTDGTLEQRRAFLLHERRMAPAAARERLAQALPELPAKERVELLPVLQARIGPEDEPLLERCRADRSREVRDLAVQLLMQVDGAAHTRRAQGRLAALLRSTDSRKGPGWALDAPTAVAPDWEADQIVPVRPQHDSLGDRAWWLYQLVRQVPVGWWTAQTGLAPAQLLQWAATTDWAEALSRGWLDALAATREPDWCEAFLAALRPDAAGRANPLSPRSAQLLQWLPQERRERHWQRHVDEAQLPLAVLLSACLDGQGLGLPLSQAMTRLVLARARDGKLKEDYGARPLLAEFCAVIHPDCLDDFATVTQFQRDGETASHADAMTAVSQAVALRRALHHLPRLTSRTP
ncbi:DUF5691 domain-containing protein [Roseateles depolymerans]|uniref:Uncharacterized protein n=1 Tax=Roseateles depolymerans TaxID=76731 RepID=A0A0U3M9D1_9BURK|nr:DUF5691 domain-containing protein [Roseateles depolymerans]ALV04889.1 hypothetical protein RD2015_386 [Roseateles depolymerans]REG15099.1 hypothetical protein DES44_3605 [Roseateles depolymerans]